LRAAAGTPRVRRVARPAGGGLRPGRARVRQQRVARDGRAVRGLRPHSKAVLQLALPAEEGRERRPAGCPRPVRGRRGRRVVGPEAAVPTLYYRPGTAALAPHAALEE